MCLTALAVRICYYLGKLVFQNLGKALVLLRELVPIWGKPCFS